MTILPLIKLYIHSKLCDLDLVIDLALVCELDLGFKLVTLYVTFIHIPFISRVKDTQLGHAHKTGENVKLKQQAYGQENEVEEEHHGTHGLGHLPLESRNGDDDEDEHGEEKNDGTEEALTTDIHRPAVVDRTPQEPR